MTLTRTADLIDADRIPHNALRQCEVYLKRRMYRVENAAVLRQQHGARALTRDLRNAAFDLAGQYGMTTLDNRRKSAAWREAFMGYATPRLQRWLDALMRDLLQAAGAALTGGYYGRLWLLDMTLRPDTRIQMPALNADALLGTLTEDVFGILFQSLASRQWREQVGVEVAALNTNIRRAVVAGITDALPVPDALQKVAQRVTQTFNRVQTITRTVVNTVSNIATIAAFGANRDALDGYEWLTARDERVCPACQALDGKPFQFDQQQKPPPLHWNCRCTLVPRVKPEAQSAVGTALRQTFSAWADRLGLRGVIQDFLTPQT